MEAANLDRSDVVLSACFGNDQKAAELGRVQYGSIYAL